MHETHAATAQAALCDPVHLLWHSGLRGDNAGRLQVGDVITADGESARAQLWRGGEFQPGTELYLRPDGTKTLRAANSGRVAIQVLSRDEQHSCCIWWLQQLGWRMPHSQANSWQAS